MQENNTSLAIGHFAEHAACEFLKKNGLQFLEKNFTHVDENGVKRGEIDLIMRDKNYYVFIEVKRREKIDHGEPLECIDRRKQTNIIRTATVFLLRNGLFNSAFCRFDVIGILPGEITWIKDAFQVNY